MSSVFVSIIVWAWYNTVYTAVVYSKLPEGEAFDNVWIHNPDGKILFNWLEHPKTWNIWKHNLCFFETISPSLYLFRDDL